MLNDFFDYPGLVLTKAEEGDYTGIIELVRHCFADAEKVNGEAYTNLDDIKLRLAQGYELYAVKDGNNIIASVLVLPEDDEFDNALYFGRLCVTEVWRRRGLAPTLVKALIAHARDLGRELVVINFLKINPWLQSYYEKFGFVQQNEIWNWKDLEVVPMQLKL